MLFSILDATASPDIASILMGIVVTLFLFLVKNFISKTQEKGEKDEDKISKIGTLQQQFGDLKERIKVLEEQREKFLEHYRQHCENTATQIHELQLETLRKLMEMSLLIRK